MVTAGNLYPMVTEKITSQVITLLSFQPLAIIPARVFLGSVNHYQYDLKYWKFGYSLFFLSVIYLQCM